MNDRTPSIAFVGLTLTFLLGAGCGDGGSNGSSRTVTAGAAGEAQGSSGANIAGAASDSESEEGGAESATGGSKDQSCEAGTERCRCFDNGTCYGSLSCLSGRCVDTGAGASGDASEAAPGGEGGRTAAGGSHQVGGGGAAGGAHDSVAGAVNASGGQAQNAGTAGTDSRVAQGGSTSTEGGSGGAEPDASGGAAGNAGSAGTPCLKLLTSEAAFDDATSNLTVGAEDFSLDADGTVITDFAIAYGDGFYHHDEVTFESVATSDQADPGTRSGDVVTLDGNGLASMIGSYAGFDGIAVSFASAQAAVGFAVTDAGTEGFTLTALGSDGNAVGELAVATSGPYFAAAVSHCGAVIESLEIRPNRSETGEHHSQFWRLGWVEYAR